MISEITNDILKRVYDLSDMTDEELRCKFFQKLEECIDLCNNTSNIVDWLKNEEFENIATQLLTTWRDDGTLNKIIDDFVIAEIKQEILDEIKSEV